MARTLLADGIAQGVAHVSIIAAAARVSPMAKLRPAADAQPFFKFENQADDPTCIDIHIVDFIGDWIDDYWGFGVTAKGFIQQLADLPQDVKNIRVHINSPGGDVFSASNIANALRDQQASKGRTVETIVDGLAASAASVILMAGATVKIADTGLVMIHNPSAGAYGESKDLRATADALDTIRNTIVAAYKWHSTLTDAQLIELMDAATWMDADAAIANGFATAKVEGLQAAAVLTPAAIDVLNVPETFRARVQSLLRPAPASTAMSAVDVMRVCREGSCLELAENLVASNATPDQVTAAVADAKTKKTAAASRATEIRALCVTAKFDDLADSYVASGMSVDAVRTTLTTLKAKLDGARIDGTLPVDSGSRAATPVIDTAAIYSRMNAPQQ